MALAVSLSAVSVCCRAYATKEYDKTVRGVTYTYTVENNAAAILYCEANSAYIKEHPVIRIPSKLGGYPVKTIESFIIMTEWDPEDLAQQKITLPVVNKVVVPASVETIGKKLNPNDGIGGFTAFTIKRIHLGKNVRQIRSNPFFCDKITVHKDNPYFVSEKGLRLYNKKKTQLYAYLPSNKAKKYTLANSVRVIKSGAFCNSSLKQLNTNRAVKAEAGAFDMCYRLSVLTLGKAMKNYEPSRPGSQLKNGCNIVIDSDNRYLTLKNGALFNKKMTKLLQYFDTEDRTVYTVPKSVTHIGRMAFYDCYHLKRVKLPSGLTDIGDYAFCMCGLSSVTVPASVVRIGRYAISVDKSVTVKGMNTKIAYGGIYAARVYAPKGSYAESYCQRNDIVFKEL